MTHGPIRRIRESVRNGQYFLTAHARDEMAADGLEEEDVEATIASGRIVRIQQDQAGRRKYTIEGRARDGRRVRTVCRHSHPGEVVIVITVYEVESE